MRLLNVFEDIEIIVRGKSCMGRYDATYVLVRREDAKRVTLEDLEKYVENLRQRYPERGFKLRKAKYRGKTYYVIDQDVYERKKGRRKRKKKDRVPIYFDLERQEVYIPESYWRTNQRLAAYILMRTLGALGISTVKYVRMGAG